MDEAAEECQNRPLNCSLFVLIAQPPLLPKPECNPVCACVAAVSRCSKSSLWAPARASPRCRPAGVTCTAKPAPSAAWRATPTAPGTDRRARATSRHPKGTKLHPAERAHLIRVGPALVYNKEDEDKDLAWHLWKRAQLRLLKHFISTVASDLTPSRRDGTSDFPPKLPGLNLLSMRSRGFNFGYFVSGSCFIKGNGVWQSPRRLSGVVGGAG